MKIEDVGELTRHESLPTSMTLHISVVHFKLTDNWMVGPSGTDKDEVISFIRSYLTDVWRDADKVRIYSVELPLNSPKN